MQTKKVTRNLILGIPSILYLDFETRSTVDLRKTGVYPYAEHPTTDITIAGYCFGNGQPQTWYRDRGFPCPPEIINHVSNGGLVVAHNAQFDRTIWNAIAVKRYGWPELHLSQTRDTMAMCYALSLPGSLDGAAKALNLPIGKDKDGNRLCKQMAKPRKILPDGDVIWWDDEDRMQRLVSYCIQDIEVLRALYEKLIPLSGAEQKLWELDQKINSRGIQIDSTAVDDALIIVEATKILYDDRLYQTTSGAVPTVGSVKALAAWLSEQGVHTDSVDKETIVELLAGNLPDVVIEALTIRQEAGMSSVAKLSTMKKSTCRDGRIRGTMQYHAATTGRWGGRLVQVQNLPRGYLKPNEVETAISVFSHHDAQKVETLFGSPLKAISSCIRGMIIAPPGKDLAVCDYSSIEARVLPWLAGEDLNGPNLKAFAAGLDIYKVAATGIYNTSYEQVTKDQRFVGKIAVLALGYQGGVVAFQSMARQYGVEISEAKAENIRDAWRGANPIIKRYWWHLEQAAINAVKNKGHIFRVGKISFRRSGRYLGCRLPSGRWIVYMFPRIVQKKTPWGAMKETVGFFGVDSMSKKWTLQYTYGGKLAENVTQAVARDIMAHSFTVIEAAGLPIVMHVHDEIVCEVPTGSITQSEFENLMRQTPSWAEGLPIDVEGWIGKRYRK